MGHYVHLNEEANDARVMEWNGDEDDLRPVGEDVPFCYAEDFSGTQGHDEDNTLHDDGNLRVYTGRAAAARAAIDHLEEQMDDAGEHEQAMIEQNIARLRSEIQATKPKKRPSQTGNASL